MQVQTLREQLLFVTVRITTMSADGRSSGSGTGFVLAEDRRGGGAALLLVTNKHVIEGAAMVTMHFMGATTHGGPALGTERPLHATPDQFTGHPDPDIDVAIIGIGGALEEMSNQGTPVFFRSVSTEMCATNQDLEKYEPIEPVTFVGYPNGLYDATSLLPIVRQGHAATALAIDYEGKPTFLIDASVFPGSSGSPVFLIPNPSAPDKHGNITLGGTPSPPLFLGIVAAVHQRQVPVLQTNAGPQFVYDLIDLGIVYKARAVLELARQMIDSSRSPG